jgi:hypothetical protein
MMDEEITGSGLYCFLNAERACSSDCMAYQAGAVMGADYQAPDGKPHQWTACTLLVHSHKVAKHIVLAATLLRNAENRNVQVPPQAPVLPQVIR